jgi:hypothetical protein
VRLEVKAKIKTKHIIKMAGKREQGDFAKVVFGGAGGF